MAIEKGDSLSGCIGGVIHYVWKGRKCRRIRPAHVRNPKTAAQTRHRDKIRIGGKFLRTLSQFIQVGYQETSKDTKANEAMSYLVKNCFIEENGKAKLDYSKFPISRGEMMAPADCNMTITGNKAEITWEYERTWYSKADDKLMIAIHVEDGDSSYTQMLNNAAYREACRTEFPIPITEKPVHLWLFFHNSDNQVGESRRNISDSVYFRIQ